MCLFVRVGFGGLSSLVTSHRTASQIEIVWSCLPSIGMFRNDFVGNDDIVHILYMWHLWWGFQMVDKGVALCIVGDFCGIHCFVLYIYIYISFITAWIDHSVSPYFGLFYFFEVTYVYLLSSYIRRQLQDGLVFLCYHEDVSFDYLYGLEMEGSVLLIS